MSRNWSLVENRLIVEDYFEMLLKESKGQGYFKSVHRRRLRPKLVNRSEGALEFKYCNISAVLIRMGLPYVEGYRPANNFQMSLREVIADYVSDHREIIPSLLEAAAKDVPAMETPDLKEVKAPKKLDWSSPAHLQGSAPQFSQINYLLKEQENHELGRLGEEAVMRHEFNRLSKADRTDLASQVEWTARDTGDWEGFDIRSFYTDGSPLFIEVKTTKHAIGFPFFISANEVAFSETQADAYCLYRVFSFRSRPKFFVKCGPVSREFRLHPSVFKAWP